MRGDDNRTGDLFSYVDLEERVRRDHPLRAIRTIVNQVRIPIQTGRVFRFEVGHHSGMKPASIPINNRPPSGV